MANRNNILRWLKAVALLPLMALVLVPAGLLTLFHGTNWLNQVAGPSAWQFWVALPLFWIGIFLAAWTMSLFIRFGDGTAAPWDPPQKLVIRGPYKHVRNPMITGAIMILAAEALLVASWAVTIWFAVFTIGNAVYMPFIEERSLQKRFGDDYAEYKQHVSRWVPRLRPWQQESVRVNESE